MSSLSALEKAEASLNTRSRKLRLKPKIPEAVYFCSIEPPSLSYQQPLERALAQLQREDPSFRVHNDETTMQTVLGGMGELHLDIIKSRILSEYKIDADLGPLQIAYSETIEDTVRDVFVLKKEISGTVQEVTIDMTLTTDRAEVFSVDTHPEAQNLLKMVNPKYIKCMKTSVQSTFQRGILIGGQVIGAQAILHSITLSKHVAESFVMSATAQCVHKVRIGEGFVCSWLGGRLVRSDPQATYTSKLCTSDEYILTLQHNYNISVAKEYENCSDYCFS